MRVTVNNCTISNGIIPADDFYTKFITLRCLAPELQGNKTGFKCKTRNIILMMVNLSVDSAQQICNPEVLTVYLRSRFVRTFLIALIYIHTYSLFI